MIQPNNYPPHEHSPQYALVVSDLSPEAYQKVANLAHILGGTAIMTELGVKPAEDTATPPLVTNDNPEQPNWTA